MRYFSTVKSGGINDNFHFTTQAGVLKEYNLTAVDRAGGLFITLIDAYGGNVQNEHNALPASNNDVVVEEFKFEEKKKAVAEYLFEHNTKDTVAGKHDLYNWRTRKYPTSMKYNNNGKMGASGIFDYTQETYLLQAWRDDTGKNIAGWSIRTGNASFSFWIKMNNLRSGIFGMGVSPSAGHHGFSLSHTRYNSFVYKHIDTTFRVGGKIVLARGNKSFKNTNIKVGEWNHVVLTFKDTEIYPRLYLNKKELIINEIGGNGFLSKNPFHGLITQGGVGMSGKQGPGLMGELDTFRVYDFVLSKMEIDALYDEAN